MPVNSKPVGRQNILQKVKAELNLIDKTTKTGTRHSSKVNDMPRIWGLPKIHKPDWQIKPVMGKESCQWHFQTHSTHAKSPSHTLEFPRQ